MEVRNSFSSEGRDVLYGSGSPGELTVLRNCIQKGETARLKLRVNARFLMFFQTWVFFFRSLMSYRFQYTMCRSVSVSGDHNTSGSGQIKKEMHY